ncbi:hypothetical protein VUR80DRAFT_2891 [Thermomyces stellatus]
MAGDRCSLLRSRPSQYGQDTLNSASRCFPFWHLELPPSTFQMAAPTELDSVDSNQHLRQTPRSLEYTPLQVPIPIRP